MALFNFGKRIKESSIINMDYKPSISDVSLNIVNEQFKGEVEKKDIKFPQELGEEHPFDFKMMEELCKKFGMYDAVLDKYNDFIWGSGFYTVCDDEKAKKIIDDFIVDIDLPTIGRTWTKEGLNKGNGFLEIGGSKTEGVKGLKPLNANYMYVNRDKFGKILNYNQYTGAFNTFNKSKVIPFEVDNIAHFAYNIIGDCAYGIGLGYPAMKDMDNLLQNETDMHKIANRKANSPLHAKLGRVDGNTKIIPKAADVTAFGQKMETMSNKTEWATDDLVNLSVVDFGNIGEKFKEILDHDMQKLLYDFQIPPELMGQANIPEGMARVRMEAFQKRIQSIQAELEKIIEEKIFKRVLNANGLDIHVEFEWGTPSIMEIEGRLKTITELIKSLTTSPPLKMILEDELVDMMDLDKDKWEELKTTAEEARAREEARTQPLVPGQNAGFPPKPVVKSEVPPVKQPTPKEMFEEFISPIINKLIEMDEKRDKRYQEEKEQSKKDIEEKKKLEEVEKEQKKVMQEKETKVKEEPKIGTIESPQGIQPEVKPKKKRNSLLSKFKITRKEKLDEGWLSTDDGRHIYIDDEGKGHTGKKAMDAAKKDSQAKDNRLSNVPIKSVSPTKDENSKFEKVFDEQYTFSKTDNDIKSTHVKPEDFLKTTYEESLAKGSTDFKDFNEYKEKIIIQKNVEGIKNTIKSEDKRLPKPFLEFSSDGTPKGHEGRHTAVALEELGYKSMPVTIVVRKGRKENYEYEKECKHCQESWNDVNDIEEWLGFKYKDYIKQILSEVKKFDFDQIRAITENERNAGYLSDEQIEKLKGILEDGFKNGKSMTQMADEVDKQLQLRDLYRMTEDGDIKKGAAGLPILQKSKDSRAISIVRSEVTRLANMGAVDYYKENGIDKVRWVASFGNRTCPDCEALNGMIYEIGQEEEMPLHPMCRCTYAPVVEIK